MYKYHGDDDDDNDDSMYISVLYPTERLRQTEINVNWLEIFRKSVSRAHSSHVMRHLNAWHWCILYRCIFLHCSLIPAYIQSQSQLLVTCMKFSAYVLLLVDGTLCHFSSTLSLFSHLYHVILIELCTLMRKLVCDAQVQ